MADFQRINHPTLGSIDFPASMSDDEVVSAIKRLETTDSQPAPAAEEPGLFQPGSTSEAIVRGASQGATFGFGDEIQAAIRAGGAKLTGDSRPVGDIYSDYRDTERAANVTSSDTNPVAYTASNIVGSVPAILGTGGAGATVKGATAIGAGVGLGNAEGSASDQIMNTVIGGATGGAIAKVAPVVSRYGSAVVKAIPTAAKIAGKSGVEEAAQWSGASGGIHILSTIGKTVRGENAVTPTVSEILKPAITHTLGPAGYAIAGAATVGKGIIEGAKAGSKIVSKELAKTAPAVSDDVAKPVWAKIMAYVKQQPKGSPAAAPETKTAQEIFTLNQTNPQARQILGSTTTPTSELPVPQIRQVRTEAEKNDIIAQIRARKLGAVKPVEATTPAKVPLSTDPAIRKEQILNEIKSRNGDLGAKPVSFEVPGAPPAFEKSYTVTELEDLAGLSKTKSVTPQSDKDPAKVLQGEILNLTRKMQAETNPGRYKIFQKMLEAKTSQLNK